MAIATTVPQEDVNNARVDKGEIQPSVDNNKTPLLEKETHLILDEDLERQKKLMKAPAEIHDLMKEINDMLDRGEDIPDSLIQELEVQINATSDFNVIELMDQYSQAASFTAISVILEIAKNRHRDSIVLQQSHNEEYTGIPDIPSASMEELMQNMRPDDVDSYPETYPEYSMVDPIATDSAPIATNGTIDLAKEAVLKAKESESNSASSVHNQQSGAALGLVTNSKNKVPPSTSIKTLAATPNQAKPLEIAKQTYQTKPSIFAPLMSSLAIPFKAMLDLGSKKPVYPHLDKETYTQLQYSNQLNDFRKKLDEHKSNLLSMKGLVQGSMVESKDTNESFVKLKATIVDFVKQDSTLNQSYNSLIKIAPESELDKLKDLGKEYKAEMKVKNDEIMDMLKVGNPNVITKMLSNVWKSVSKRIDAVMGSRTLNGDDKAPAPAVLEL